MRSDYKSEKSPNVKYSGSLVWGAIQILVWIVGAGIVVSLVVFPELGMDIFWNLLIPVAPVLFVIIVGLWRNICPLASTSLIPEYLKLSKGRKLSLKWQGRLQLIGLISLLVLVPLRHVLFDVSPLATALLLIIVSIIALTLGFVYDAKSIWCWIMSCISG